MKEWEWHACWWCRIRQYLLLLWRHAPQCVPVIVLISGAGWSMRHRLLMSSVITPCVTAIFRLTKFPAIVMKHDEFRHFISWLLSKQCCNWLLSSFLCDGVVFVVTGGWQLLDVAAGCVGVTSDVCVEQNTRLRPFNVYCTDARICCDFSHSFHCHLIRLFALYPGFS